MHDDGSTMNDDEQTLADDRSTMHDDRQTLADDSSTMQDDRLAMHDNCKGFVIQDRPPFVCSVHPEGVFN